MATRERSGPGTLSARLRRAPQGFEWLQALQILEREQPHLPTLGRSNDPQQEAVRLRGPLLPVFSPSQISSLQVAPQAFRPLLAPRPPLLYRHLHRKPLVAPRLTLHTPVFGLGGPDGPLPYAYQEWLQQRVRAGDQGTVAFLDLFQHRLLSLLYRVQLKQRIALPYQRSEHSPVYQQLQALCGLTSQPPGMPTTVPEKALIARAALLANGRRSVAGLQSLLRHHFDLSVRIEDFLGGWRSIPEPNHTVLGRQGRNLSLGRNAVCGSRAWDQQQGVRIHLGPLQPTRADSFMPGRLSHRQLAALVSFYFGAELHCELRIHVDKSDIQRLGLVHQPGLGQGSWLNREVRKGHYWIDVSLGKNGA